MLMGNVSQVNIDVITSYSIHYTKLYDPLQGDEAAQWYEVDKIFGKEARDIIGPENRDSAMIDRYDTKRFSRSYNFV